MGPLAKESIDLAASTEYALAQQSEPHPKPPSDQAPSAAVSLEVPVQVFGSHAAVVDKPSRPEPFSEKTNTIIVLSRGGVLRMATAVNVGQMLVMTNLKSRKDVICRVTKVRSSANGHAYVEIEFLQPNPTYWGVSSGSKLETGRLEASSPKPSIENRVPLKALSASAGVSSMPSAPMPFIVSPTVHIEESVSLSNRETSLDVPAEPSSPSPEGPTEIDTSAAPTADGFEHRQAAVETFTDIADKIRQAFARVCNTEGERTTFRNLPKTRMLVAGCAAALLILVAGGVLYFYPKAQPRTTTTNVASSPSQQMPTTPAVADLGADPVSASHDSTKGADVVVRRPAPPRQLIPASHAMKMLKTHPRPSERALDTQTSAPAVGASESAQPAELLGIASSIISVAPPRPAGPIVVGGAVKEPRLIASRLPVYPAVAKQARVQGDVVIDTQIDTDGRVMQTKIVSGPVMLRQAAVDALRTWKYEPPRLDGQPIQVETLVMIKFRL